MKQFLIILIFLSFLIVEAQTPPIIYVTNDGTGDYNCDGDSDQIEINQAIEFVTSNPDYTTVFLKEGLFLINEPVLMSSNVILTGEPASILKLEDNVAWWTHNKPIIGQTNAATWSSWGTLGDSIENVEIYGFEIDGGIQEEPAGDTYIPTIHFYFPENVSIHDMYLHDNRWDIIRLTSSVGDFPVNTTVYNNLIKNVGHEGVCFVGVTDFEAYNNKIYHTRTNSGIRAKDCNNFIIHDNIIGNSLARSPSGYAGILLENEHTEIDNAEIYGNLIYGKDGGIHLSGEGGIYPKNSRKDVHIHHNKIYKVKDRMTDGTMFHMEGGIKVNGYQNTLIEHNIVDGGTTDGIIYQGNSGGESGYQTIVRNNIVINNYGYGINNKVPSINTFIANNNLIYNNELGSYNNTISTNDIYSDPLFGTTHSTLNNWYHIAATYDNITETFKIYVNGVEYASEKYSGFGSIGTNTKNLFLGGYRAVAYWYTGAQDELAIWNKPLTVSDISTLYNNGIPQNIQGDLTTDLQMYFKMENSWNDNSGNNYNEEAFTANFTSNAIEGNYAGLFTGIDGVQYPNYLDTSNGITISVWVYRTNLEEQLQTIVNKGREEDNDLIWLYFNKESVVFEVGNGTTRIDIEANVLRPEEMDFHLKSEFGRWNGNSWIIDEETSPCIDTGDLSSDFSSEPTPNGGRVNMGVYGNTIEASKSSDVSAVEDIFTNNILYPNPSSNMVFFKEEYGNTSYRIITSLGKVIKIGTIINNQIDVSNIPANVYFVIIKNKTVFKLIKK